MSEIARILDAYANARLHGRRCALATVTAVAGSSYRQVGARMLVTDDGAWLGCVSGGCLERDLLRKAAWAMERNAPLLATYDTRDDSDEDPPGASPRPTPQRTSTPGAGLGCNGVIEILVEPIAAPHAVLDHLASCRSARRCGGVMLLPHEPAPSALCWHDGEPPLPAAMPASVQHAVRQAWAGIRGRARTVGQDCGTPEDRRRIYLESLVPPVHVAVLGAGPDAVAMAALGVHLGYEVTVVDFRSGLPVPRKAFAGITRYIQCAPRDLPAHMPLDQRSVVIVMTHQAQDDLAVLPYILGARPAYIGLLGPRKRAVRLLESCAMPAALDDDNLHAPIGLDLGAETPVEIAQAVFAEIQAHLHGRSGRPLRSLPGPIHARMSPTMPAETVTGTGAARAATMPCPMA